MHQPSQRTAAVLLQPGEQTAQSGCWPRPDTFTHPTTAIVGYTTGLRKLSANGQFIVGAQMAQRS